MLDGRSIASRVLQFAEPAGPFAIQMACSTAAYALGLAVTQVAGKACRVSCATPVMGPAMGCLGIGLASSMAGQASIYCRNRHPLGKAGSPPGKHKVILQEVALDAVIGILLFKTMGGRFRSLLPSDLFRPGALAVESLPATRGADYASEVNRGELLRMMRRDGCHHCGRRGGKVVGDHIPPNKLAATNTAVLPDSIRRLLKKPLAALQPRPSRRSSWLNGKKLPLLTQPLRRAGEELGLARQLQRYYPQCTRCSSKQSAAVRGNERTLVLHFGGPRPWFFAGALVGLRHFQGPQPPPRGNVHGMRRPLFVLGLDVSALAESLDWHPERPAADA